MKIYLHIGMHKTGTTSIQAFARENVNLLRKYGVFWPVMLKENKVARQHSHLWRLVQYGQAEAALAVLGNAITDAEKQGCQSLLLSGEGFSNASEPEIATILDGLKGHEIVVIVYFRNIYGYARSAFQQHLKYADRRTPARLLPLIIQRNLNYDALLARWQKFVPGITLDVRSYEREKKNLVPGFFAALGIPEPAVKSKMADESNRSMDPVIQVMLAAIECDKSGGDFRRTRDAYYREFGGMKMNTALMADIFTAICQGAPHEYSDPLLEAYRDELLAPPDVQPPLSLAEQAQYFSSLAGFARRMARRKRFESGRFYSAWRWARQKLRKKD
ncbi:hypothetical protein [Kordiimonas aestuarii]|uniref:hypothetical protein n=1 Tax=Kordiimonas aestuarii TaxID=1005925 RepID=UPI0021CF47FF|nr:hypothetical protein [Kordiimonas aestuarii]